MLLRTLWNILWISKKFKVVFHAIQLLPQLIMFGSKILMLDTENVRFIDSVHYFSMSPTKLPKVFDLPPTLKKGFFPNLFNTKENENYSMLNVSYYRTTPPIQWKQMNSIWFWNGTTTKNTKNKFPNTMQTMLIYWQKHVSNFVKHL